MPHIFSRRISCPNTAHKLLEYIVNFSYFKVVTSVTSLSIGIVLYFVLDNVFGHLPFFVGVCILVTAVLGQCLTKCRRMLNNGSRLYLLRLLKLYIVLNIITALESCIVACVAAPGVSYYQRGTWLKDRNEGIVFYSALVICGIVEMVLSMLALSYSVTLGKLLRKETATNDHLQQQVNIDFPSLPPYTETEIVA
ncbi:uncharacterized protein LOC130614517 isoform X2 [Hydractinia symbiolongicarpus]|uniref:uncharacterized protein LOC130614517 isoform X2 n=1 Tax=Hydractinia symbiolongicarpus TaxID=13093 RepID=UPI002550351E|nr:uncharacterized protein LOC130614517 isoform X2 [Hydractinia symbiolongicarpus]